MALWKGIVGKGFTPADFDSYVATLHFDVWTPEFVVLHNTASPTFAQWHDVSGESRMQGLQHYYRDIHGWSGGPHLFIADDVIWAFTPLTVPGVHSPSWNAISWGVELVGDYSVEQLPPGLQQNAVAALATLHAAIGLDPSTIRLHKEDPKTTHKGCPGKNIVKADVISWIQDQLAALNPGEHDPTAGP